MNKHVGNRFASTVRQWFLRVSSRAGFRGLPLQVYFLLALGFVFSLGRNIAFPYLAMFLNGKVENGGLGFDSSLVGSMLMIGGLSYTFTLLAAGSLCDRFGRKTMMVASLIPQCFMVVGFAFARSYPEFLLLYALTNIVGAFYDPAYGAMIADLVQPERREEVYGLGYMTGNMGTMVGPIVGGVLASVNGYSVLFLYAAIFAAATTAGLVLLTRESKPKDIVSIISFSQFAGIFRDKLFVFFCFMGALTNLVYTQLYGLLSVYIQYVGFEPYIFGILFSLNGAMVVTCKFPSEWGQHESVPRKLS